MTATKRCALHGCDRIVSARYFLCRRHWEMVPVELARAVWEAWSWRRCYGTPESRIAHLRACSAAVKAVAELEIRAAADVTEDPMQRELFT